MFNRIEIKSLAKEQIKGNIWWLLLIELLWLLIMSVAGFIPYVGGAVTTVLLSPAYTLSILWIYLGQANGIRPSVARAFDGFSKFWVMFKLQLFTGIFVLLWSLLLIIPGIIKSFSYAMAPLILAETPDMPPLEAINRSKQIMHGHKMDFFVLELSFIGWILLGAITCGIAYIWVVPYMQAAFVNFYNSIKSNEIELN